MKKVPPVIPDSDLIARAVQEVGFQTVNPEAAPDTSLSPEEVCRVREAQEKINEVLETLTSREKKAVRMCFMDGHTRKQAAQEMGVSLPVLQSLLRSSFLKLNRPARLKKLGDCLH